MYKPKAVSTWLSIILLTLLTRFTPSANGQDLDGIPQPQVNTSFPVEHGQINLSTGGLHLEIPLESYAQRGEVNAAATLVYDSNFWTVINPCGIECYQWEPVFYVAPPYGTGGWHIAYNNPGPFYSNQFIGSYPGPASYTVACQPPPPPNEFSGGEVVVAGGTFYIDTSGSEHDFIGTVVTVPSGCQPEDGKTYTNTTAILSAYATDGSGYYATWNGPTGQHVWDRNGNQVYPNINDRNGNQLQYSASTTPPTSPNPINGPESFIDSNTQDTLGRNLVVESHGPNPPSNDYPQHFFDVLAPNGTTARYTVNYKQIAATTNFNQKDASGNAIPEFNNFIEVISSIGLPDGTSYQFTYNEGSYGELKSVTLPHGGTVSYTYQTAPGGLDPDLPILHTFHRYVQSHTGADGATTFAWQYQGSSPYSEFGKTCGEITNNVQNQSISSNYTFSMCNGSILPKQVTFAPLSTGAVEATQLYDYDLSHQCPLVGQSDSLRACPGAMWRNLTAKTTVLAPAAATAITKATPALTTDTQYAYDNPGLGAPSSIKQWDYYQANPTSLPDSPPGLPARETDQTLAYSVNNAMYPTLITHKDVTGTAVSTTTYTYDEPNYFVNRFTTSSAIPGHDDSLVTGNRGNLTTTTQCCAIVNGQQAQVTTHATYDDAGSVVNVVDANGRTTSFGYDSDDALVTNTTLPQTKGVSHVTQTFNDANTGLAIGQLDQNTQGTGLSYDSAGRVIAQVFSNGGSPQNVATLTYPSANETDLTSYQNGGIAGASRVIVDGFGRTSQSVQENISTETTYDAQGRVYSVTNPHAPTPSSTDGTTIYSYDELGRVHTVTSPLGKVTTYQYAGNTETITDPLGHSRSYTQDVFGDLTSVLEPDLTGALNWGSVYNYDGLGRLKRIDQTGGVSDQTQWRTRLFSYDGAGNLQSQSSPEQGTTTYCYDNAGNLLSYLAGAASTQPSCTPGAGNGYSVAYGYDEDNRLTSKQIAGGTSYTYTFDGKDSSGDPYGIGRLTGTTNGTNVQTLFTHDAAGRVNSEAFCLPSDCSFSYKIGAAYDFQDNLLSLTYPDGRQIAWNYDAQNRLMGSTYAKWNADQPNLSYLATVGYAPTGELTQANYGGFINYAAVYDANENVKGLAYMVGNNTVTQKTYTWDDNGANLRAVQDSASGRTQSFNYDPLDRLQSATDSGSTSNACLASLPAVPASSESYNVDAWGNLKQSGSFSFMQNFDANNRISASGYVYDPSGNGNLIQDGLGNRYQYNADGLLAGSGSASYTYDALGQRVRKDAGSSLEYFYFGGQLVATRDPASGAWTDRLYGPGGVFATVAGTENAIPKIRMTDHLGSLTGIFDPQSGQLTEANSLAYGESNLNATGDNFAFTDHERDAENGSDATLFRHYSPEQGRWLSPDPYNGSVDLSDPQSFNRYAYLSNRPLAATDPYGLCGDDGIDDCGDSGANSGDNGSSSAGNDPSSVSDPSSSSDFGTSFDSSGAAYATAFLPYGNLGVSLSAQTGSDAALSFVTTTLDIVGFIPELGVFANGINAGIQYSQGNRAQAGLYLASAAASVFLPGGSAIAKSGRFLQGLAKTEALAQNTKGLQVAESLIGDAASGAGVNGSGIPAASTYLYQKLAADGSHLKYGITVNPLTRYSQAQLAGGRLKILAQGAKADILGLERSLHETLPIGSEERQSFYIQKQIQQGLKPPPY